MAEGIAMRISWLKLLLDISPATSCPSSSLFSVFNFSWFFFEPYRYLYLNWSVTNSTTFLSFPYFFLPFKMKTETRKRKSSRNKLLLQGGFCFFAVVVVAIFITVIKKLTVKAYEAYEKHSNYVWSLLNKPDKSMN